MARAVVTFHSIDDSGSVLSFSPRAFRQLIERLAASATPVVTFEELLRREDGITITFDDGMRSVYQHALPVLRQHGFPAHIFLTTGRVGQDIGWPSQPRRFDMLRLERDRTVRASWTADRMPHGDASRPAPVARTNASSKSA